MTDTTNPANALAQLAERRRIPMSVPQQKLRAEEIPGYFCYWMRGTPERLQQAQAGGYEFVTAGEARTADTSLGGDAKHEGSTDLGTRVSVLAGGDDLGPDGQPIRLYLMKIREEWHQEDLRAQAEHSERLRQAMLSGAIGAENDVKVDRDARYVGSQTSIFQPRSIRRS